MRELTNIFYNELRREIPGIRLNGHRTKRLPNTLNVSFPNAYGSHLLDRVKDTIAASTGSACHEGRHTPSSVLTAMGLSNEQALSAVRFSVGRQTTLRELRKAAKNIVKAYRGI